jgi:hypothetical protein
MTQPQHEWIPRIVEVRRDPDLSPDVENPAGDSPPAKRKKGRGRSAAAAAADGATAAQQKAQDAADGIAARTADLWAKVKDWAGDGRSVDAARDGTSLWETHPPSLAELWAYTRAGGWMPGDQRTFWERVGQVYGLIAIAITAAAYLGLFLIARPERLLGLAFVLGVLVGVDHYFG